MNLSSSDRSHEIERSAGEGDLETLRGLLSTYCTQLELDVALENAVAYSRIEAAEYLLSRGARFSHYDYQGVYNAVHNNELDGLKFAIAKGVDINVNNGMLINTSIVTATNTETSTIVNWLIDLGARVDLLTQQSLDLIDRYGSEELRSLIESARKAD